VLEININSERMGNAYKGISDDKFTQAEKQILLKYSDLPIESFDISNVYIDDTNYIRTM
jgi:hypothetical protein